MEFTWCLVMYYNLNSEDFDTILILFFEELDVVTY